MRTLVAVENSFYKLNFIYMKYLKTLSVKDLFVVFFPVVSIVSNLVLMGLIYNLFTQPYSIIFLNKIVVSLLLLGVVLFEFEIFRTVNKLQVSKNKQYGIMLLLSLMLIAYIITFQLADAQQMYLNNAFFVGLLINTVITLLISLIIKNISNNKQ